MGYFAQEHEQLDFTKTVLDHLANATVQTEVQRRALLGAFGLKGSAAHQLVFESLLRRHEPLDFSDKFSIFETFRKLHPIMKEQHFLNPKEEEDDPYESTQITALIANAHGIFGVYSMREVFEYTQFWAAGTGREFALGAMQALYPRLKTAEAVARAGVEAGAMFDKNSALPMTIYNVKVQAKVKAA